MEEHNMRVYLNLTRVALVLTGLWMAIGVPAGVFATEPGSTSPQLVIAEPSTPANLMNYTEYYETADTKPVDAKAPVKEAAPALEVNCGPGCGACSDDGGCCPHWILGIETVWLSPQLQRRPFAEYEIENEVSYGEFHGGVPSGLFITPRITLGFQGECWGIQTRYWRMNECTERVNPGNGRDIFENDYSRGHFKAETFDLEATRMFCWNDTTNQLSFGVRYAQLDESTSSSATRVVEDALFTGTSFARNEFSGAGLTLGLAGYKPLQCRCFNLYYNARISAIWDTDAQSVVQTQSSVLTDSGAAGTDNGAIARGNGTMYIAELQVGPQWNFKLCQNRADAFVRLALEYQYWSTQDTGGAAAVSDAFIGSPTTSIIGHSVARAGDARTDLIGFNIATGFTW
jgi:hypothetical protein